MEPDPLIVALTARRRELALTQRTVAARIGVAQSLLSYWERGIADPSPDNQQRWAEALHEGAHV